jgi:transposase
MLRLQLNDTQEQELHLEARQAIGRVSERIHFVLLAAQGYSPPEIAQLMGYDTATVRMWLSAFIKSGGHRAALDDAPRSGRPRSVAHLDDVVETQVGTPPTVNGYLQAIWTVALLVGHLAQRCRIGVSTSTVRRALKRLRFSWHRPKLSPARRPDPEREAREAHLVEVLADSSAHVVAADECDVHLLPTLRSMWQRIGQQRCLPTPGQNKKRALLGGFDLRTGDWFYQLADHKRTADFIAFLILLLAAYPVNLIYVIVDNASIHSSQALLKWLAVHNRLRMVYLPTYSGHRLNPVEKVWWRFKGFIAANRCVSSLEQLDDVIRQWFDRLTPAQVLTLTNCSVTRMAALVAPT